MAARNPAPDQKRAGQYGQPTKYRPECCDIVVEKGKQGADWVLSIP